MLALASGMNHVDAEKKSYRGRQMRQFLVAWMRKHCAGNECLWDRIGPGKDAGELQDFQTYLDKFYDPSLSSPKTVNVGITNMNSYRSI